MKIRFLAERVVKDHEGKVIDHFKPGQVRELSENSARRWLHRGLAEELQGGKTSRRKAEPAAETTADEADPDAAAAQAAGDSIMAERKAPRPADPLTHADHPAVAKATGKEG